MEWIAAILLFLIGSRLFAVLGWLTIAGAFAAFLMASLLYAAWGINGLIPALTFLIFSSIWTRWPGGIKGQARRRNVYQVIANGLPAALFALLELFHHHALWNLMMAASFAAAAADTWSTEWGRPLGGAPLSLRNLKPATPGDSGAISAVGTLASLSGSGSVALASLFSGKVDNCGMWILLYAGLFGGLVDSLAGAWIQGLWRSQDGTISEEQAKAGAGATLVRGVGRIDNNVVNLFAAGSGALFALLIRIVWPD